MQRSVLLSRTRTFDRMSIAKNIHVYDRWSRYFRITHALNTPPVHNCRSLSFANDACEGDFFTTVQLRSLPVTKVSTCALLVGWSQLCMWFTAHRFRCFFWSTDSPSFGARLAMQAVVDFLGTWIFLGLFRAQTPTQIDFAECCLSSDSLGSYVQGPGSDEFSTTPTHFCRGWKHDCLETLRHTSDPGDLSGSFAFHTVG